MLLDVCARQALLLCAARQVALLDMPDPLDQYIWGLGRRHAAHASVSGNAQQPSLVAPAPGNSGSDVGGGARGGGMLPAAVAAPAGSSSKLEDRFEDRCLQLEAFYQEHGHTRVPMKEPTGLGTWVAQQRHLWKAGRLAAARQQRLAALGLSPDAFQDSWSARFRQLAAFHSQHGHCRVPYTARAGREHPGLHSWLNHQIHLWRQGTLADERRRRLEGLGVEFAARDAAWEQRFQELLRFWQEYGHTCVPRGWPANPGLANWVMAQRKRWHGKLNTPLTESQQSRLLGCGFRFDPHQDQWDRRYAQLSELKLRRGGDLLCAPLPVRGGLAAWASQQRQQWRRGKLAPERVARLEALGFAPPSCSRRQISWQQRLATLDRMVALLGFPALYALLLLAPSSSAAAMAAAALDGSAVGSGRGRSSAVQVEEGQAEAEGEAEGEAELNARAVAEAEADEWHGAAATAAGGGLQEAAGGSSLAGAEAAAAVRWHRSLRAGRMPVGLAQALASRGLLPAR